MAFLGIDEAKAVAAIAEKLEIKPGDTAVSLLRAVLLGVLRDLSSGKQLHGTIAVQNVRVDYTLALEDKP